MFKTVIPPPLSDLLMVMESFVMSEWSALRSSIVRLSLMSMWRLLYWSAEGGCGGETECGAFHVVRV